MLIQPSLRGVLLAASLFTVTACGAHQDMAPAAVMSGGCDGEWLLVDGPIAVSESPWAQEWQVLAITTTAEDVPSDGALTEGRTYARGDIGLNGVDARVSVDLVATGETAVRFDVTDDASVSKHVSSFQLTGLEGLAGGRRLSIVFDDSGSDEVWTYEEIRRD